MGSELSAFRIVPELQVPSVAQAVADLAVFGFVADGARVVRGDQVIDLVAASGVAVHGAIDHLALKAVDTDAAGQAVLARGARVDAGVTPDGPQEIAEFWGTGVRYQFFQGPGTARLELCARRGGKAAPTLAAALLGHDHVGICVRDIAASVAFYEGLGLALIFGTELVRPDGVTSVRFLARGSQVVELYRPPVRPDVPGQGLWRGLRFEGLDRRGEMLGPDGERVVLA